MYYSRENLTVFKHNLELSWNADFLHVNSKLCIVNAKFGFKKIEHKCDCAFWWKMWLFRIFAILTPWNEHVMPVLRKKESNPRERILENIWDF